MNQASTRKVLMCTVSAALCLAAATIVVAQETQPTASETLEAAVRLFEDGDYVGAQHALGQISQERLADEGRAVHSSYVPRAAVAVSMHVKADADHEAAALAVSDGRMAEAKRLLRSVLDNQYAATDVKEAAETELELLEARWPESPPQTEPAESPPPTETPASTEAEPQPATT